MTIVSLLLTVSLAGTAVDAAGAVTIGPWSSSGSLNVGRSGHTATLLRDGSVLVSGGEAAGQGTFKSSELYDPSKGTWSLTGSMQDPRMYHTASLLQDGRVLVTGGAYNPAAGGVVYLRSCEIYDPVTGTWSPAAPMTTAREFHSATLLADGSVLVVGGENAHGLPASAEIYDPSNDTWSPAKSMSTGRFRPLTATLTNGNVLVAGGYSDTYLSSAKIYDASANTWLSTGGLQDARYGGTATVLEDGMVLVAGGENDLYLDEAELYDPSTGEWSTVAHMSTPRQNAAASLLPDGRVLVAGGANAIDYLSSAEVYDESADEWLPAGSMAKRRYLPTSTLLPNKRVLVVGEIFGGASTELFREDPTAPITSAPVYHLVRPSALSADVPATIPVLTRWSASDPDDAIASYQVQMKINGGPWSPVSLTSPTSTSVTIRQTIGASFAFRVRAKDTFGNLGSWEVGPTRAVNGFQESSLTYNGTWTSASPATAWEGGVKDTTESAASAVFSFNGDHIAWIGAMGPRFGSARVYLDGVLRSTVNCNSPTLLRRRVLLKYRWPTVGTHRIRIVNIATAGHPKTEVDGLVTLSSVT
jgi:hypothetical protein